MRSRALANSFKLAKLDFHFAGTAAEQWSSFSATTWRDNNQRTSFLLVLCCIATCLTAIFLSLSFCMWIRPGRKKINFLPRHIPKARFCFAILEFNEYLDWGFRSSRSSIRSWWMTCLVTDGCRLCATYFNPSIVPPHVLIWAPSLGCQTQMQRWLCTNIRRSRMRRQQRNPDRFEWTTIIKRFEDRAYGRLDSSLLFNYSFVHLPAPLTASRYMLQVRNAMRWMVIKDNEQEKQKEQEELIGIEVEEWKKGPRKAKEETTGVNTWWMMMIDSRVMNYDDPDSRYIDAGEPIYQVSHLCSSGWLLRYEKMKWI